MGDLGEDEKTLKEMKCEDVVDSSGSGRDQWCRCRENSNETLSCMKGRKIYFMSDYQFLKDTIPWRSLVRIC